MTTGARAEGCRGSPLHRPADDVVIVRTYREEARASGPAENSYKGLRMYAIPGLHAFVARKAVQALPPASAILDLASGSGALSLRLHDLAFRVTATDIVQENFRPRDRISFVECNLNREFARELPERYDAVMAIEIIEHVENPRNMLRECYALLRPGGVLFLSTPNLDSPVSKALYLRFGTFQAFDDEDYEYSGHMTPVSPWYLGHCAQEAGFEVLWKGSYGDPYEITRGGWIKLRVLAKLLQMISLSPRESEGEILFLMLRRPG